MPPAVIAGGVAAVGAIGGGILSASAQKKAAKTAAGAEQEAAAQNIAAAREFRAANQANFQPWLNSGTRANSLIDSFLYAPSSAPASGGAVAPPTQVPTAPTVPGGAVPGNDLLGGGGGYGRGAFGKSMRVAAEGGPQPTVGSTQGMTEAQWAQGAIDAMMPNITRSSVRTQLASMRDNPVAALDYLMALSPPSSDQYPLYQNYLARNPRPGTGQPTAPIGGQPGQPAQAGTQTSGYQAFVNSPYYQFGLNEGINALNNGYAANGMIQSGAAMKGITKFGQDYGFGKMNEFIGLAENQSNRGIQAGGAIAGVSTNALNNITSANNAIGNAAANRAIAGGVANANMWSGIGSALGTVASSFSPRGY